MSNSLSELLTQKIKTFGDFEILDESQDAARNMFEAIANELITHSNVIARQPSPFPNGRIMVLSGNPGCGKTHLLEAMIGKVQQDAPELLGKMFLLRNTPLGKVTGYNLTGCPNLAFGNRPIILIDDLFSEVDSVDNLIDTYHIIPLMALITSAYEKKWIIIMTSNFPFIKQILPRMSHVDRVGRVVSRCYELVKKSGEIQVSAPDYRQLQADVHDSENTENPAGPLGLGGDSGDVKLSLEPL